MKILVQKFGGTSVDTPAVRERAYSRILSARQAGYAVVAVCSGMGRRGDPYATDTLLDLIQDCPDTAAREIDLLAICCELIGGVVITANLQKRGVKAAYLTGWQAGIRTDGVYGDARVLRVDTARLLGLLERGVVPVVAGGQGLSPRDYEISMLGRGGSDTTACALGAALGAERVEIYTDVDGVMTADPRIVPEARLLRRISYRACTDMACQGAKVMHPRSVEAAASRPSMELVVRSIFSEMPGTLIGGGEEDRAPVGVALLEHQVLAALEESCPALARDLPSHGVSFQPAEGPEGPLAAMGEREYRVFKSLAGEYGVFPRVQDGLSKVSLVGSGLDQAWRAAVEQAAARAGAPIVAAAASDRAVSVWVKERGREAARAVHGLLGTTGADAAQFERKGVTIG